MSNLQEEISLQLGTPLSPLHLLHLLGSLHAFQLANVTCIGQYLKNNCSAVAIRNVHQAEIEVEPQDNDSLPDRLLNPGQYEPPFHTPQQNATAEPTENEGLVQKELTPVYTFSSIN